ncbi:MAG: hypothetical protein KDA85_19720, partial [Planctomycetaceae bacterium]|nr:hypothetical protein [Planctomycetaceae bacterium]
MQSDHSHKPHSRFPAEFIESAELASRALDSDLSPAEQARLSELTDSDQRFTEFQSRSLQIGELLRDLPSSAVGNQLRATVRAEIEREIASTTNSATTWLARSESRVEPNRQRTAAVTAALVATTALASLLWFVRIQQPNVALNSDHIAQHAPARGLAPAAATAEARIADATDDADVARIEAEQRRIVLTQTSDWDVVVVRIPSNDRDAAIRRIEEVASASGLQMPDGMSAAGHQMNSFGVLLTSATRQSERFVEELEDQGFAAETPTDNRRAGEMERDELIQRIRTAMQSPSLSELNFGKVYVAVPRVTPEEAPALAAVESPTKSTQRIDIAAVDHKPGQPRISADAAGGAAPVTPEAAEGATADRSIASIVPVVPPAVASPLADTTTEPESPSASELADGKDKVILVIFEFDPGQASLPQKIDPAVGRLSI